MKIKKWWWKNYKSYGQVKECIEFDPNSGKLYLINAPNGGGKTTAITATDLALYGEVSNKQGKRLAKENYPNRINGDLEVGIEFENKGKDYYIKRTMQNKNSPLKTTFKENDEKISKTGLQKTIQEKIGFDYKTYKSFISMDVNVFKNFMSLTPEEKRILLDKLFNIEQINKLNKLLKQLKKDNDIDYKTIQDKIKIYDDNINDLLNTIEEYKVNKKLQQDKVKVNNNKKINELKTILNNNKEQFISVEEQKTEIKELVDEFEKGINKLRTKKNNIERDIVDIEDKIDLYKCGKCPTCLTELTGELNLLDEYEESLEKTQQVLNKINNKLKKANVELINNKNTLTKINEKYNTILNESYNIKAEIKSLKNEDDIEEEDYDIEPFEKNIEKLKDKKNKVNDEFVELEKLKHVYKLLEPLWGENGIKRDIIDSIIDPINSFIEEDLTHLNIRFKVSLDNNFDAHLYEFNNEIDPDTLSTGEAKKINLIIMLAYIKMLRTKSDINILFLDEVFSSIDVEGIDEILVLFKKFANERNINIFLVHHSELKDWLFDKIIKIEKNTFSYIVEN